MRTIFLLLFLLSKAAFAGLNLENCQPESAQGPFLYNQDFKWGYSLPEMLNRFSEIYESNKRLKSRAYYDQATQKLILPYDASRGGSVVLPVRFVEQVVKHIEAGFRNQSVDAVFFPDMGHSHFFIPEARYQEVYIPIPVQNLKQIYETFFSDPTGKILYHTAEQLKTRDEKGQVLNDAHIQHRHKTRNLVGPNDDSSKMMYLSNPQMAANTSNDLPGYAYWGAGFNLSANKKGCFSYKAHGKTYNFDISLYDLDMDPEAPLETQ